MLNKLRNGFVDATDFVIENLSTIGTLGLCVLVVVAIVWGKRVQFEQTEAKAEAFAAKAGWTVFEVLSDSDDDTYGSVTFQTPQGLVGYQCSPNGCKENAAKSNPQGYRQY